MIISRVFLLLYITHVVVCIFIPRVKFLVVINHAVVLIVITMFNLTCIVVTNDVVHIFYQGVFYLKSLFMTLYSHYKSQIQCNFHFSSFKKSTGLPLSIDLRSNT